ARDEVPIGAVIIDPVSGQIVASAHNETRTRNDPTAHAEILAIRAACERFGAQRIPQFDLYVTLEPCPMCAAAISFARLRHVYFAATDEKSGGFINGPQLATHRIMHHKPEFSTGLCHNESADLLRGFFQTKRKKQTTCCSSSKENI